MSLLDLFEETQKDEYEIIKPPFIWMGGKSRSLKHILPHLPSRKSYIEPFGGSAAVLLGRPPSTLEVYNDRYQGLVDFYRCIRDPQKYRALISRLELVVHAREEFVFCKANWDKHDDVIERAARWYTMIELSFGGQGRNFGRTTAPMRFAGKFREKLPAFGKIHERFKRVQVEHCDWASCFRDYDSPDAVFYVDPPYLNTSTAAYKCTWSLEDQKRLLETIHECEGFVALSGYDLPMNNDYPWDDKYSWQVSVTAKSLAYTEGNHKDNLQGLEVRDTGIECLWIKE